MAQEILKTIKELIYTDLIQSFDVWYLQAVANFIIRLFQAQPFANWLPEYQLSVLVGTVLTDAHENIQSFWTELIAIGDLNNSFCPAHYELLSNLMADLESRIPKYFALVEDEYEDENDQWNIIRDSYEPIEIRYEKP